MEFHPKVDDAVVVVVVGGIADKVAADDVVSSFVCREYQEAPCFQCYLYCLVRAYFACAALKEDPLKETQFVKALQACCRAWLSRVMYVL